MTFVTWNPAWETGILLIDDQHRQLLAQCEALFAAIHEDHLDGRIPGLLAFLAKYVETHFALEEEHMEATQYPERLEHRAVHDELRAEVTQLVVGYRKDPAIMTEKVIDFLTNWLIGHINSYDRRLARHLIRFGTGESRIPQ